MAHRTNSRSGLPDNSRRADEDTAEGCEIRAAADLARAVTMDTLNGRRRLEASAASWSARAALLRQAADGFEAERALAAAEWKEGEEAVRYERPDDEAEAQT